MRNVKSVRQAPRGLRSLCDTKTATWICGGEHRVVDGVFARQRKGDIVAHEVLLSGDASISISGHVEIKATGNSVVQSLGDRGRPSLVVSALDEARVEIRDGEVQAWMNSHIIARGAALVHVIQGTPTIEAFDGVIVIVRPGARPKLKIHDDAQIINRLYRNGGSGYTSSAHAA